MKMFYIQYSVDGSETDCYIDAKDEDDAAARFERDYGADGDDVEILTIEEM